MNTVVSIVLNSFKNDSRVLKEAISLQKVAYLVKVVALYEETLLEYENVQSINVHRIKLKTREWSKSRAIQLIKYFEFTYKVIKLYKKNDIFHCNDLNTLPIGVIVKIFFNKNVKIIYDAHEHETERYNQGNKTRKLLKFLEGTLLRYVDSTITVSDSIAEDYKKIYGIKKPELVFNCPLYRQIEKSNIFREKFSIPENNIIFLYQGGLSKGRGILEFADLIANKKNVSYVIMGYGNLENEIIQLVESSKNVHFHEAVSPDILLNYTSSADIGVCIEENLCKSWDYALPNKMFEYHMSNLPIIVSGLSEMKRFVVENGTGYVINDIFNKREFDDLFLDIQNTYKNKQKCIEIVKQKYNWEEQEKTLLKIYKCLFK